MAAGRSDCSLIIRCLKAFVWPILRPLFCCPCLHPLAAAALLRRRLLFSPAGDLASFPPALVMMEPADADNDEPLPDRLEAAVGSITVLPRLTGIPLGHDCSWKGSQVSRLAALQTGGIGRDRYAWGAWWAEAMSDLGADIAALTETRIDGASAHNAAINGMWDAGYLCISHNVSNADRRTDNPLGSGVALAIKREVAADWTEVTPGPHGRALGGSIRLHNGAVLRVVAVYGPTGACLPGFTQNLRAVQHETDRVTFLQQQVAMAQAKDWTLVVLGDLNSFTDGALDKWQGQWQIRDECLAVQCREMGLIYTWRDSHPTLPGFTHVSPTGSASRLDSIWILPAIGFHTPVLNSALLWNWHKRVDHHPVLIDLGIDIPTVPAASSDREQPRWRKLADMAHGHNLQALKAQVEAQMETHRPLLMQAAAYLSTSHATLSEIGMVHGQTPPLSLREVLCSRVHQAHDSIMAILHQTLPTTNQPSMDRKLGRAQNAWDTCLALLRSLKHILIDSETHDLETANSILNRADVKWRQGLHFLDKRGQVTIQRDPWDWDGFHTQLDRWLACLSAPGAPQLRPPDMCQPVVDAIARNLHWAPSATETADRILLVEAWIQEAQTLRAKTAAHKVREGHERRVHLLRSGDLRRWARCWRTPVYKRQAYTPQQITTASGTRRPKTPAEMRKAAAQEWQKLFDHPSRPWSHELVHTWTDPSGFLRGSPKTHDVQAPPDVLQALLCPGPWSRCVFRGSEVQCLVEQEIRIQIWRFRRVGGLWEGKLLGPCEGQVQCVVHINGQPAHLWTLRQWLALPPQDTHCLLLLRPKLFQPLHVWGPSLHMKDPGGCPRCRPPDLDLLDGSYAICISTLSGSKTSSGFLLTPNWCHGRVLVRDLCQFGWCPERWESVLDGGLILGVGPHDDARLGEGVATGARVQPPAADLSTARRQRGEGVAQASNPPLAKTYKEAGRAARSETTNTRRQREEGVAAGTRVQPPAADLSTRGKYAATRATSAQLQRGEGVAIGTRNASKPQQRETHERREAEQNEARRSAL
ncbi:unnamed protein product [Symbiodinium sp. CCMP2592]|nr:unnamed protein product [Symbiodinium sp. CCMP2592]